MTKFRRFVRKYKIFLSVLTLFFIDSPQWIDAILNLKDRMNETGVDVSWLWWITVPIGILILGFIVWQSTRPSGIESKEKWEHYNKLVDLIIQTETAPHSNWGIIVADMQRELNAISDSQINKMMRYYFPVLDEEEFIGIHPQRFMSQTIIDMSREHMIKKYKRYE